MSSRRNANKHGRSRLLSRRLVQQIVAATHEKSGVYATTHMTTMKSQTLRHDAYGNQVIDKVVFECTSKHPRPELFSVIPTGDKIKPRSASKKNKGHSKAALIELATNPSG
jgi:hypothetical protein